MGEEPEKIWAANVARVKTWHPSKIGGTAVDYETEYIRADLHEALEREYAHLEAALTDAKAELARIRSLVKQAQHDVPQVYVNWHSAARATLAGSGSGGWRVPEGMVNGPVPAHECEFRIGQAVHLANPYAEEDPSAIYYVAGITWDHRAVPSRGWNISIAAAEDITRGYGQTDGFVPSDLRPALPAAQEGR
ncbi:hypothetical protein [Pseudaminobacter sp. NGMCC 1.201702]|uniref:hypothetical protein n=1 Tax=Pseudaminobacter sp. NGMCC 1.201702 TaxID=3391825 RepID=UPI0039F113AF